MNKEYIYHVYDTALNYIGLWPAKDVISDFGRNEEINAAGSEIKVQLGRPFDSFNEGVDIDFNFTVKIYCVDTNNPNGLLMFTGKIKDYAPHAGDQEYVEVTLLGGGADLESTMMDWGDSIINQNASTTVTWGLNALAYTIVGQTFTITERTRVNSIDVRLISIQANQVTLTLCSGTPTTYGARVTLGSVVMNIPSTDIATYRFTFADAIDLTAAGTYYFILEIQKGSASGNTIAVDNEANHYSGGFAFYALDTVTDPSQTFTAAGGGSANGAYDLWFSINAGTIQSFYSKDPSDILRKILDYYAAKGGTISYDGTTIDSTGTTVSYPFNGNTTLEGVQKVLDMSPVGWYWYIDQSTNMLHFHQKVGTITHKFVMGKHIKTIVPEKRYEDVLDVIYFTGGGDPPLFQKFKRTTNLNGGASFKYIDGRVTNSLTAARIAQRILDNHNAAEIRLSFELNDNSVDSVNGYDIESINMGDTCTLRNIGLGGSSLFDVAFFDVDYWDYNPKDLGTIVLQVVRKELMPDGAKIYCSTIPPDVTKRIADINRNLQNSQTSDNSNVTT